MTDCRRSQISSAIGSAGTGDSRSHAGVQVLATSTQHGQSYPLLAGRSADFDALPIMAEVRFRVPDGLKIIPTVCPRPYTWYPTASTPGWTMEASEESSAGMTTINHFLTRKPPCESTPSTVHHSPTAANSQTTRLTVNGQVWPAKSPCPVGSSCQRAPSVDSEDLRIGVSGRSPIANKRPGRRILRRRPGA